MRLLVDIGNSLIKCGWSSHPGRIDACRVCGTLEEAINAITQGPATRHIFVADVRGDRTAKSLLKRLGHAGVRIRFLTPADVPEIKTCYRQPAQMGIDRLLALLAASRGYELPAIVISAGTAVTVDALSTDGQHAAGVILPGMRILTEGFARVLPKFSFVTSDIGSTRKTIFSEDTRNAIGSGLLYCWSGGINEVVADMQHAFGETATLIVTGGDGLSLTQYLQAENIRYAEQLVLKGMSYVR